MAVMLAKTYEALKDAGASDEKAREAAEEIAGFESRLASIENRLIRVEVLITIVLTAWSVSSLKPSSPERSLDLCAGISDHVA